MSGNRVGLAVLFMLSICLAARGVLAGANCCAGMAVHVLPHDGNRSCTNEFPDMEFCYFVNTTHGGCEDIDVFPVFFYLAEYQGFDYGLSWPGASSCAFTSCSDLSIGRLESSGDGISHAWYTCQPGPLAIPGWGWITGDTPGRICIVPHPLAGGPNIGDCSSELDQPVTSACAGICGEEGDEPCYIPWNPPDLEKDTGLGEGCVNPGDVFQYNIVYGNTTNPLDIGSVVLHDALPDELIYLASSGGGLYDPDSHTVTWSIGTVPSGHVDSVQVTVRVRTDVTLEPVITNSCEIWSEGPFRYVSETTTVCGPTKAHPETWGRIKAKFR
jgi:hypothetical protein